LRKAINSPVEPSYTLHRSNGITSRIAEFQRQTFYLPGEVEDGVHMGYPEMLNIFIGFCSWTVQCPLDGMPGIQASLELS
jgi:hypothetical protein